MSLDLKSVTFSSFVFTLYFIFVSVGMAVAQECASPYQLIFELNEAEVGSYNVWDAVYGEQDYDERFIGAVPVGAAGHHVAAGARYALNGTDADVILTRLDHRGRVEWERSHKVAGVNKLVSFMAHKDGYIVVADKKLVRGNASLWIGFFDGEGELLKSKEISDKRGHLYSRGLLKIKESDDYFLLAFFEDVRGVINKHAALYRIDGAGRVVSKRAYMPGLENGLLGLNYAGDKGYFATGYIMDDSGRRAGWVLGLNEDGSILWQHQYPRGFAAQLRSAHDYGAGYLVVTGDSKPYDGGNMAGWVMLLNDLDGEVVWQRYYRGGFDYSGRALLVNDEGLISVMMNGRALEEGGDQGEDGAEMEREDHVRLLTLNPRGNLLFGDSYFNGRGANASQMFFGNGGQRVMVGATQMNYQIEAVDGADSSVKSSLDGWIVSAVGTEPYDDPCVRRGR